ncbi:hypothetical protein [Shewanella sp. KT0246]|uniref:hypothetical protein n=1 Tax=Shewanella sp. KT0246 TaxID=2815912 RepID=UPI001BC4AF64|nr:hypothetical protein [Shewanella sp. KT0246]GIU51946.1 hypothetical protein TUM4249_19190 [Shewanella sp. KT0246]
MNLYRVIRTIIMTSPAKLGRMLLIAILTMQSVGAMADDCSFEHQDCDDNPAVNMTADFDQHSEYLEKASTQGSELCDEQVQVISHIESDCSECSNNCCSCCMTLMHPITVMHGVNSAPDSFVFSFNSTAVEAPYFSFLRPPQV